MGRNENDISNYEYDKYLSEKGGDRARREIEKRTTERRNAHNANGEGWHFGLGDSPVRAKTRDDLKRELDKRGLMLRDDVKKELH